MLNLLPVGVATLCIVLVRSEAPNHAGELIPRPRCTARVVELGRAQLRTCIRGDFVRKTLLHAFECSRSVSAYQRVFEGSLFARKVELKRGMAPKKWTVSSFDQAA